MSPPLTYLQNGGKFYNFCKLFGEVFCRPSTAPVVVILAYWQ